jgi:hypothetical protein
VQNLFQFPIPNDESAMPSFNDVLTLLQNDAAKAKQKKLAFLSSLPNTWQIL